MLRAYGDAARDEESLVMGLLLPDAPVVTWWPGAAPEVPGTSPLGRIAQRRITDASTQADPQAALHGALGELHAGRHRLRLDAADAVARPARRRARPAAVRAGHGRPGHRGGRLTVDDAARGVAAAAARGAVRRASSPASKPDRTASTACASSARAAPIELDARRARRRDPAPAEPADARRRAPPPQPPRLPRRRAAPARPR